MYGTGISISSKEQTLIYKNNNARGKESKRVYQLLTLARGFKEYVYLRIEFGNGDVKYYLNEFDGVSLSEIEDDELFNELSRFIDEHHEKIKPEGSCI